jgi:hypothetical protein
MGSQNGAMLTNSGRPFSRLAAALRTQGISEAYRAVMLRNEVRLGTLQVMLCTSAIHHPRIRSAELISPEFTVYEYGIKCLKACRGFGKPGSLH